MLPAFHMPFFVAVKLAVHFSPPLVEVLKKKRRKFVNVKQKKAMRVILLWGRCRPARR